MAIKISGSTIIDDSKNIVSAGIVTATSFYGDGSNLTNLPESGGSTLSTAQATTSGTTKTFTDVPATANKITIMFNNVSHAASSNRQIQVRLGTSGGIISSGYTSIGYNHSGTSQNRTDCFVIYEQTAAVALSGHMIITKLDSTTYVSSHQIRSATTTGREGAGHLQSISGTIDRIEISIQNKDFSFDSGSINVLYQ